MNYKKIYDQLITRGQRRVLEGYVERHHIIPRCMDGSDDVANLVALTPEEHYVAHLLLIKIYPANNKLVYAAKMMCTNSTNQRRGSNKTYGWVRRKLSLIMIGTPRSPVSITRQKETITKQFANGRIGCRIGTTLTDDHKLAISAANAGKQVPVKSRSSLRGYILRYGEENGQILYTQHSKKKASNTLENYIKLFGPTEGPIKFDRRCQRSSAARRGKPGLPCTDEAKRRISVANTGRKMYRSPEHNAKIGMANKGKLLPKIACIHCGVLTSSTNNKRWHNDNCKHKLKK